MVLYLGPGFIYSATWPFLSKKHFNGLIILVLFVCFIGFNVTLKTFEFISRWCLLGAVVL